MAATGLPEFTSTTVGGTARRGGFPVCATEEEWDEQMKRQKPFKGLPGRARNFIHSEQPISFEPSPADDPLLVLHRLDNEDKHDLVRPAFVCPPARMGLDLIEVSDRRLIRNVTNEWTAGRPLAHGTRLATFVVTGEPRKAVRASTTAQLGFATGDLDSQRTSYIDMIERVRGILDGATTLIDASEGTGRRR